MTELHWVIPGHLAGAARPGLLGDLDDDIRALALLNFQRVVTLTEAPLALDTRRVPFEVVHFPIDDMGVPTPRAALPVCLQIAEDVGHGRPVLLHCKAGLGRTGTMLAACLVTLGQGAHEAIAAVRQVCQQYIQTPTQAGFVLHFEDFARGTMHGPVGTATHGRERPWS